MKRAEVDVAIIGAGTAGYSAYRAARAAGATAMLVEGGAYGTTCARVACMPSKLLIAAADAAHAVRSAPAFGVQHDGAVRVDGRAVMDRVRRERDRFVDFAARDVERIPEPDRPRGHAVFADDHTLEVGGHTRIDARAVVVATGSQATRPESFAALGDRAIVSDDIFDWQDLPRSVAVIGTGIIALELGQALHRLGVRVAMLGRGGRVGPIGDPEILACATTTFAEEFALAPDAGVVDMRRDGGGVAIHRATPDGDVRIESFDLALFATGRAPRVGGIGLEKTSVKRGAGGVPEYDHATTRAVGAAASAGANGAIFIAGDVGNFIALQHEAADEGRIAGTNAARLALGRPVQPGVRRAPIAVVFTDPQIGIVGGGFRALQPGSFATGQVSFADQGRARILMLNKGLMNVYADLATGLFLGAEMLAPGGEHLAHLLAWALQNRMTVEQMLAMPYYHPVLEEGLRTALRDVSRKLRAARRAGVAPA